MIKTILASLTGFGSDKTVLDAAFAVARNNDSHVTCLHTRIDPIEGAALFGVSSMQIHGNLLEMTQRISREQQMRSEQAKSAFEEGSKRNNVLVEDDPKRATGPSAILQEVTTFLNETLRRSRYHDLIVMARVEELSSELLRNVVMQSGRPVLIPPSRPVTVIGDKVMIAWKDGPEAARALAVAMPILARAKNVTIVWVCENGSDDDAGRMSAQDVADHLRWHGIQAKVQTSHSLVTSTSKTLEEIAIGLDADLLILGAYGHSRMREFAFGGVTRDLLNACAIPILMAH